MSTTDRIEKTRDLHVPRARAFHALTDSKAFGTWFKARFHGVFEPGAHVWGELLEPGTEGLPVEVWVEAVNPPRFFSLRWHPHALDTSIDYSKEPTTLVEFVLDDIDGVTKLTVMESGFDAIPEARRAQAFAAHEAGWAIQLERIGTYLDPT